MARRRASSSPADAHLAAVGRIVSTGRSIGPREVKITSLLLSRKEVDQTMDEAPPKSREHERLTPS
jgi:hypothetical protein